MADIQLSAMAATSLCSPMAQSLRITSQQTENVFETVSEGNLVQSVMTTEQTTVSLGQTGGVKSAGLGRVGYDTHYLKWAILRKLEVICHNRC